MYLLNFSENSDKILNNVTDIFYKLQKDLNRCRKIIAAQFNLLFLNKIENK